MFFKTANKLLSIAHQFSNAEILLTLNLGVKFSLQVLLKRLFPQCLILCLKHEMKAKINLFVFLYLHCSILHRISRATRSVFAEER